MHPGMRGGDWNKTLLQGEHWLFILNVTSFPGLNEVISYKPFLEGFVSGGPEPLVPLIYIWSQCVGSYYEVYCDDMLRT